MAEQSITDEDIQALVDGELPPDRLRQVKQAVESDPWMRERYTALRQQKMLLLSWWALEFERTH